MIKIVLLDTGDYWGGGTNSMFELLKRVDRSKYKFTVVFYRNYKKGVESDVKTEIEKLGIDFILLKQGRQPVFAKIIKELVRGTLFWNRKLVKRMVFLTDYHFKIVKNAQRIAGILRETHADLLYMNNQPSSNLEGILAARDTATPVLQHCRIQTILNEFELKAVNAWLPKIICVSEGIRKDFIRQGIEASRCAVVHNAIDPDVKPAIPADDIRKQWGLARDDILVGTVGSLKKRKQTKDLLLAMSAVVRQTELPVKCLIVGEGKERENLASLINAHNLSDRVIFTGFQPDGLSYVNALDIFAMTSEQEGLPRVILEAMLFRKPVVACNVIGPSELVTPGETGFLVPLGNTDRFAEALLKLVSDRELRKRMGEKAQEVVIRDFHIRDYVAGVEKIFDKVTGN